MKGIRIALSDWQIVLLEPFFEEYQEMLDLKKPGMLLAQIMMGVDNDYWLEMSKRFLGFASIWNHLRMI